MHVQKVDEHRGRHLFSLSDICGTETAALAYLSLAEAQSGLFSASSEFDEFLKGSLDIGQSLVLESVLVFDK